MLYVHGGVILAITCSHVHGGVILAIICYMCMDRCDPCYNLLHVHGGVILAIICYMYIHGDVILAIISKIVKTKTFHITALTKLYSVILCFCFF